MVRISKPPRHDSGKGIAIGGIIAAALGFLLMIYGAAKMLSSP
jgi:hypothetical protein